MKSINLSIHATPQRTCSILVGDGALNELPHITAELDADLIMVLYDEALSSIFEQIKELLPEAVFVAIPSGESSKSLL